MYRAPRGMQDILPDDQPYWQQLIERCVDIAQRYGYRRIDTPIVESTEVFLRGVGETTDVVEKEMYTFLDKGANSLTLRPEFTAAICRAYLEHGMASWPQPVRLYSIGPLFRYDRPQAGRYRQFHQFNVEAIGEGDPTLDAEVIDMAGLLYEEVGLSGLHLLVNSIGDDACRPRYIVALRDFFGQHLDELCSDCRGRLGRNPLRVLDCKHPACRQIGDDAPRSVDWLCDACAVHFATLTRYLDRLGRRWQIDHRLVRGLDYYTRTVFEYQPADAGAQSAIGGGGRYDGLIAQLGGRPTPGVGFATGLERIVLNQKKAGMEAPPPEPPRAYLVAVNEEALTEAVALAAALRRRGIATAGPVGGRGLKGQMRHANASGARYAIILGPDELAAGEAQVKPLHGGEPRLLRLEDVADALLADT
ncbi:MAG: histidine--tRNA ligase [Chloroflexota bacterium]|nr:histidine--tRNA ligase [Dehalococcoidia bacterium]MDW8254179.1 histidine--tRNA ligase [Chloroflexota bacterium]